MRFYVDCEFIDDGHTIDLISVGVVDENDRSYYAVNQDCNFKRANEWVKANVLPCLPPKMRNPIEMSPRDREEAQVWKPKRTIRDEFAAFTGCQKVSLGDHGSGFAVAGETPEFWTEWGSYDWLAIAQLFGTMMDLPKGFPMRCNDVIQWAETHLGMSVDQLPPSLEVDGNHNALLGAKTVKQRWEYLNFISSAAQDIVAAEVLL